MPDEGYGDFQHFDFGISTYDLRRSSNNCKKLQCTEHCNARSGKIGITAKIRRTIVGNSCVADFSKTKSYWVPHVCPFPEDERVRFEACEIKVVLFIRYEARRFNVPNSDGLMRDNGRDFGAMGYAKTQSKMGFRVFYPVAALTRFA